MSRVTSPVSRELRIAVSPKIRVYESRNAKSGRFTKKETRLKFTLARAYLNWCGVKKNSVARSKYNLKFKSDLDSKLQFLLFMFD
uniref:Uncharacterized protein n=1 Tax=Romanomermis culicivorax TaxID=13658 RepID=A0A915ISZ2_ROMCU